MYFANKNILITGGAGFIGSNLAISLVEKGARVSVVDSIIAGCGGNLFNLYPIKEKITLHCIDLREAESLPKLVESQDYIFNLMGQVSHQDSMSSPIDDLEINARAHLNILEACRHHNPKAIVVHTSTRQVYGIPKYLPVDEGHPINPVDINGIHSFAGEHYHTLYARVFGLRTVSFRLTNTFGPRQLIKHSRQGFIAWFINRALTGNDIRLFGGGAQIRDFNYVDDVVEALLLAALEESCFGNVYNLSGEISSLEKVAGILVNLTAKGRIEKVSFPGELKKIDIGDYYGTSERFFKLTGWKPRTSLEEGLRKTIEYFRLYLEYYLESNS